MEGIDDTRGQLRVLADADADADGGGGRLLAWTLPSSHPSHLELPEAMVAASDPVRLVDERWRPVAREQLARRREADELAGRIVALPAASRRRVPVLGPQRAPALGT